MIDVVHGPTSFDYIHTDVPRGESLREWGAPRQRAGAAAVEAAHKPGNRFLRAAHRVIGVAT
jgi:hypothetical protein